MSHFDYNISIVVCCSNSDFYSVTVQDVQRVWTDTCKGDIHVNLNRNHLYSFTFFLLSLTWKWILKLLMGPWQKWSRLYNCLDIYLKHTSTLNWSDVTSPISSFKKACVSLPGRVLGPIARVSTASSVRKDALWQMLKLRFEMKGSRYFCFPLNM